ncbi:MAG: TetR/AcrR family transcriptional regulator [Bacteroidota bacterium]
MSEYKKNKVKDELIEVARQVFGKYGFKKTNMDDIALAARRGKTSLYYYFKNKEEIFQAVINKEAENLKENIIKAIDNLASPEEKIRIYIIERMRTLNNLAGFYDSIRNELIDHLHFINDARKQFDIDETKLVKFILMEGISKNNFSIENIDLTASTIITILKGVEVQFFVYSNTDDVNEKLNEIINLIISGLKRPISKL